MKTMQDLKDNKEVIIDTIIEMVGESKVKQVMTIMVDAIGFNGYFEMNAVQFTKAVIRDNDNVINPISSQCSVRIAEINRENAKNSLPSSLR